MARVSSRTEAVSFRRRREVPGVEVRRVEDSRADFRYFTPDYEFLSAGSWRGEIIEPHGRVRLEPGMLVCLRPGEVCCGRATLAGSRTSLHIERDVLDGLLAERGMALEPQRFRRATHMSSRLAACLRAVHEAISPGTSVEAIRAALLEFAGELANEAVEHAPPPSPEPSSAKDAADRVRRCLELDPSTNVDLAAVARETGMSRFRALRVFKRWYGLPPHAYQLHLRVSLVQKSLRSGVRPAEAAAEYGFVDQSHLTRHFRRLIGITPAVYARIGT